MSEVTVINSATVLRILLLGGIFLILPRVTRKGLLFGAYVGEAFADGAEARGLMRRWSRCCLTAMALSLAVGLGISVAGWPFAGNLAATGILLLAGLVLYLWMYYTARSMAPPSAARQADVAVAPLEQGEPKGAAFAKLALVICIVASLAAAVHAMASYEAMPERVPMHFGLSGKPDAWSDKSIFVVMLLPSLNLVIAPFLALFGLLTARAKRSVRGGTGGRSAQAQDAFRAAVAYLLSGTALFTCALLTAFSVQIVRVGLGRTPSLGTRVWWIAGAMLLFMLGGLVWVIARYGQGGALIEQGSADAPLTNGLADNTYWLWGIFYVNRDDPSILVEKRFGFGYTINFGNPKAVVIMGTFLVLTLAVVALGIIAAAS